ncbi:MAG TPA: neocarzinostatin apoprotein domain-containing protein [Acidimicrobiales bacterium]|jgi:hypothetical protein
MDRLRTKKELLGVIGVVVAIAAGATLPIVLSATAGAHGASSNPIPVASCSPPGDSANQAVAAFSPPVCTPMITAKPSTGLGDGQTIQIAGTGYSANAAIGVAECQAGATGPGGCDLSTLLFEQSDGNGSFGGPYTVTRIINIPQPPSGPGPTKVKTIDCAHMGCFLGAADISNFSVAAFVPLGFDPSIPLLLSGTLDHSGTANKKTGVADISGTVSCTHPLSVDIYVQIAQIYKRFIFRSQGEIFVSCTPGKHTWSVQIQPQLGTYAAGVASVDVGLQSFTGTSYRDIEIKGNVHLTAVK